MNESRCDQKNTLKTSDQETCFNDANRSAAGRKVVNSDCYLEADRSYCAQFYPDRCV